MLQRRQHDVAELDRRPLGLQADRTPAYGAIRRFVDRLQQVDLSLPLRTVPLEISEFGPVTPRLDPVRLRALKVGQYEALDAWRYELEARFTPDQRSLPIVDVKWSRS